MRWTIALALACALLASCSGGVEHTERTADWPAAENPTTVATASGEDRSSGSDDAIGALPSEGGPGDSEPSATARSDESLKGEESGGPPTDVSESEAASQGGTEPVERPPARVPDDPSSHPLAIEGLRRQSYPGSDLIVVEELAPGGNYSRAVATYESEGLTIRGLLTIPDGEAPTDGWPVIIFNHGYIPPSQYRTTERYVAYQDAFARNAYITYKSDYRGHGSSDGESASSRGSPAYTIDVLNALASVARHPKADPGRIGMWGHSMGGSVTLRSMVVNDLIRAGVIWAGVVASYPDLYRRYGRPTPSSGAPTTSSSSARWRGSWRRDLVERFGMPEENPEAWDAVSPNAFLGDISGPLQLHHGTADTSVPVEYSTRLQEQMEAAGQPSELYIYDGDDHNLSVSLATALARSVAFFDRHVKGDG